MRAHARRSGLLIPLFSFPSSESWGIGEITDINPMTAWLAGAGQSVLQLLPLNEMATGQQSPYSAMSAMAIDPIFIALRRLPEFEAVGGLASLDGTDRERLAEVRRGTHIDYATVRSLKHRALTRAFEWFLRIEWQRDSSRARDLKAFLAAAAWWLDDYALFRAIHEREQHRPWMDWPVPLQQRDPSALEAARHELTREILFYQYLQWVAESEWRQAHACARAHGVSLFGDLPFMVDGDSADVWAHQDLFHLDRSIGVPPDAFSATGQDWGMPAYRWDRMAAQGFGWLRDRARRSAALFDGYRVDHLVGFYRTYSRPRSGGPASFEPDTEEEQTALGEQMIAIFREPGAAIIAEDLGIIPDFVRTSLTRLGAPGFRVFRWERNWTEDDKPFHDPADYPEASVAVTGTHDTEPMRVWWEEASEAERLAVAGVPGVAQVAGGSDLLSAEYAPVVRDVLIEVLFASRSELLLMPIQDVFGWRDRINEPSTVSPENWTFRLPWPVDHIDQHDEARERRASLCGWATAYRRTPDRTP